MKERGNRENVRKIGRGREKKREEERNRSKSERKTDRETQSDRIKGIETKKASSKK